MGVTDLERGLRRRIVRGAGGGLAVAIAGAGVSFLTQMLLANLAGAAAYGVYAYVVTWLNVLAMLAVFGLDQANVRLVAEYDGRGDAARLRGLLGWGTRLSGGLALVLGAGLAVAAPLIWSDPATVRAFWLGAAALPVLALVNLRQGALRGLGRVVWAALPDNLVRPALLAGFATAVHLAVGLGAPGLLAANLAAVAVAFALGQWLLHRALPAEMGRVAPVVEGRAWAGIAAPLLLVAGALLLNSQIDLLMVGTLLDDTATGRYAVASRIALLIHFGLAAVTAIAAPVIARQHASRGELRRTVGFAARIGLGLTVVPAAVVLAVPEFLLGLFGADFVAAAGALRWLAGAYLLYGTLGLAQPLMTMTGHHRFAAGVFALSALVNAGLNLWLTPRLGIEGAALATLAAVALWTVTLTVAAGLRLGVWPAPWAGLVEARRK